MLARKTLIVCIRLHDAFPCVNLKLGLGRARPCSVELWVAALSAEGDVLLPTESAVTFQ